MELVHSRQSPNPASRELLAYRGLLALLSPLIMAYALYRAIRDGGRDYLAQRLGYRLPKLQRPVWIHCASVGEVNAAAPLLQLILERYPNMPLLVTTNTPTGRDVLHKRLGRRSSHVFMPLDFKRAVKRFIEHLHPRAALFFETELWPNTFDFCAHRSIPLVIVNGRLSDRTLKAPAWLHRLYRHGLRQTRAILARSETDSKRFISLGARPGQVFTIGNIKFAQPPDCFSESSANPVGRSYWLAASTHRDEEFRLARIWKAQRRHENLLVIAPRHPERRNDILKALAPLHLNVALRSRNDPVTLSTQIYLADTLGEMPVFMRFADFVFMGGSLIAHGGQNIIEPARLGKAVIVGPYMSNFVDETRLLLANQGLLRVQDDKELGDTISKLMSNKSCALVVGKNAKKVIKLHADMAQRYFAHLQALGIFMD
jgi:3-deoxy-D-manno-octulosonic-acid transferase